MRLVEIQCQNCKTINEVEIEVPKGSNILGLSTICDGCNLDIYYDLEIDVVVTPY
jgi:hypothetical protein